MKRKYIFLFFIALALFTHCNYFKSQLENDQDYLKNHKNLDIPIGHSSTSIEKAIEAFVLESKSKKSFEENLYLFSWSEYRDVFLPNALSEDTLASHNTLEKTKEITDFRRSVAYQALREITDSGDWKLVHIELGKKMRALGNLKGIPIEYLEFQKGNTKIRYEGVRLVIEQKGNFKVCVLAK
jgi:hypothetical protein